ncbi:hypothetical protein P8C59_001645 [Phyllachora maydis]|uniref:Reverse transcriptase Ty1/copia-type domain-containing protein n=1 Tax=Phyllachora maydis TaxID=1825666 RepID=A0AAD9HYS6_9PEZI|nr:hypothetical protein P8C59_001645 [Phyllachora maydis]
MHLLRRSRRVEGRNGPGGASNPADLGQSSRPLPPIRTLLEDKEDGEDYSKVIEVLKQHIKSYKRVIASQSSDIKTLLLSLNTLKASIKDSVSAIKNISSTLASLTNTSNTAATRKTSYSPRFDPFSGTLDLDSPLRPPRKEPYLGPAVNSAPSNLDPPIDIGSKEGFKDTITSSIVKELSKKAYTIPDDKNPDISNTYSDSDQAVLLMLLRNSLSIGPRAAISWIHIPSKAFKLLVRQYSRPIESKKKDIYNEFHALTFKESRNLATEAYRAADIANSSNSTPNSNSNPSKKGKNKKKGKKKASYNVKGQNYNAKSAEQASFILGFYNLAIEEEEESDSSSSSSSSSDSNTQLAQLLALKGYKKHKDFKGKGLKTSSNKAKYKDNQPRRRPRDPALYNSWLYNTGSTDHISNSKERFTTFTPNTGQLRPINTGNGPVSPAGIGSIILEVLSRKAPPPYTKLVLDNVLYLPNIDINIISRVRHYDSGGCLIKETLYRGDRRCIAVLDFKKSGFFRDRNKIVVETPSNSIRKEDYRPFIEDTIVSEAIKPNKRYKLRNSPAKGTTLEGIGPSLRGERPYRPIEPLATAQTPYQSPRKTREPKPLTSTRDLPHVLREPVIEGNKVEKAISSPTLKEPNIGQRDYYNLLNLAQLWHVRLGHIGLCLLKKTSSITRGLPNFDKIKEADFHCSSYNRGKVVRRVSKALIPDLPRVLDLIEGDTVKIRPRPYNRNPMVLLLVDRKINSIAITNKETTPFQALFDELEPGIPHIPNLERYRAIGARGEAIIPLEKRSKSLKFTSRTEECKLLAPTNNTALEGELVDLDLDLEGAVSPDPSNLNTKKPISIEIGPSKLEPYESSSNSKLDEPLPDKPINPVIVESTRPTISIRKPKLLEAFPQTIKPIFAPKPIETSSYILSFVYKARQRVISKYSTPTTYKQVLKLPRDERSKWLEAITKEFIQLLELGVFKFLPRSLLPSNRKLITCRNVLKVKKDAKNRPIKYKSRLVARGFMQVEGLDYTVTYASTSIPPTWRILLAIGAVLDWEIEQADFIGAFLNSALKEEIYMEIPEGLLDLAASNKAIYKLLLKYGYNPSTPNIIVKRVFYNAKTCHFIVTYIDDCLFIGPNIGYITDLKKRLNKVYAIEDLGPAAYFLGYIEEAVSRFNLADSKPISIPL